MLKIRSNWNFEYTIEFLSIKDANMLIEKHDGIKDPIMLQIKVKDHIEIYKLNNDKVIMMNPGGGTLFSSYSGFLSNLHTSGIFIQKRISSVLPSEEYEFLQDNSILTFYRITRDEYSSTLYKLDINETRIRDDYFVISNITNNQEVIVQINPNNYYIKFKSIADYLKYTDKITCQYNYVKKYEANNSANNELIFELGCRNIHKENLVNYLNSNPNNLLKMIEFPVKRAKSSSVSIKKLEQYILAHLISPELAKNFFWPLVSFLGKEYISRHGGEWILNSNGAGNFYATISTCENPIDFFAPIFSILNSKSENWISLNEIFRLG